MNVLKQQFSATSKPHSWHDQPQHFDAIQGKSTRNRFQGNLQASNNKRGGK